MLSKISLLIALACGFLTLLNSCQKEHPAKDVFELSQQTELSDVSLHLQISQSSLKTNESAQVSLSIKHAPGVEITLPELEGQLGEWTIAELNSQAAKLDSQSWSHHLLSFVIEPDLPGETTFPPIGIKVENEEGESREVLTSAVTIEVLSVGVDADTQLRDIAPDQRDPADQLSSGKMLPWVASALFLAAIGIFFFLKSSRQSQLVVSATMDDFLALTEATPEEISSRLEPVFCKAYSKRAKLTKPCHDFTSLCCELPNPPDKLRLLISRYESLQYSKQGGDCSEIAALYQECSELLTDNFGKEIGS
ncbi:MAG: hypothetical protein ABGY95_00705 [Rubritalea sp.]|uniref:hypothetical protein n=1 Tax=Rubritalea sp. TaxID=2109375 RepID=UPI003242F6C0